jgi:urease accessory protein
VIEEMLRGLGARLSALDAPFDPEHGAYDQHHGHDHGHHHDHDHG